MKIFGLSFFAWGGVFLLILTVFQVLSGLRIIKFNPKFHKWIGLAVLVGGIIHGALAMMFLLSL